MKVFKCDVCGKEVDTTNLVELDKEYRVSDGAWVIDDVCYPCRSKFYNVKMEIEGELAKEKSRRVKEALIELAREAQAEPAEVKKL